MPQIAIYRLPAVLEVTSLSKTTILRGRVRYAEKLVKISFVCFFDKNQ